MVSASFYQTLAQPQAQWIQSIQANSFLFPWKKDISQIAPIINEVYSNFYKGVAPAINKNGEPRSKKIGQIGHVSYHQIPLLIGKAILALYFFIWYFFYPLQSKLRCIICALAYTLMEYTYTTVERKAGYTSLAQFIANLIVLPHLCKLHLYHEPLPTSLSRFFNSEKIDFAVSIRISEFR